MCSCIECFICSDIWNPHIEAYLFIWVASGMIWPVTLTCWYVPNLHKEIFYTSLQMARIFSIFWIFIFNDHQFKDHLHLPTRHRASKFIMQTLEWCLTERGGVSNHRRRDCLPNRLFRRRSKKTSKLRVTGLCEWNSPVTGEFPAQRASDAENVSICWRHHAIWN